MKKSDMRISVVIMFLAPAVGIPDARGTTEPNGVLNPGDHISLIGGGLAERLQHEGRLETLIQARFPKHQLRFRNLGFAGDELTFRHRSDGFGSPDEWLERCKTDVVFAFFGFNESFAGEEGLGTFRQDLDAFIRHTVERKYGGKGKARLVLFSPIAHENLHDRNLPDGTANNKRLARYTAAMAEVAKTRNVPFVDLFAASRKLYAQSKAPLTINGIHLTERGNERIAKVIDEALFGPSSATDSASLEKLRQAVMDKNFHWFQRYRVVDGYNVYGGRSELRYKANVPVRKQSNAKRYKEGISNWEVMDREMAVLDVMTSNRDRRIWAVAQGKTMTVDDGNTPAFINVPTNLPGPGVDGTHPFLGGEEAIGKMKPAPGMKVTLFADESAFPDLVNPVQMAFDPQGRLWVATWLTYPHWKPKSPMNDKLLIFEDTNHDGKADTAKVFADGLHCPTGFEFYNGGVLLAQAPYLVYLKDHDGDDRADEYTRLLSSLDSADTHHTANSFVFDPGGALYFQEGTFHRTQVETLWGPVRCNDACVWRFTPRTFGFEAYIAYNFANPHGHVFDRWGREIVHDGTGADPYDGALFSGRVYYPQKHPRPPGVYEKRIRPCSGTEILSSRHFPEANQGNLLVANVIGLRGIQQYKIEEKGASLAGTEVEPIVESSDPNFRPADIEMGPDGAIWFTDWHNPIIGHMQHHIRDPNRDVAHGRVYRVTHEGRPLLKPPAIAGAPIARLLDLLMAPENRVRYRAKIELGGRDSDRVIAALNRWVDSLDKAEPEFPHHLLEALWVHQWHNVVNEPLFRRLLQSPDHRARAAATRVLCYWRDRVGEPLAALKTLVNDKHPRVRLEAVRACSFFPTAKAAEIALEATQHEMDEYLNYTLGETLETLKRFP